MLILLSTPGKVCNAFFIVSAGMPKCNAVVYAIIAL